MPRNPARHAERAAEQLQGWFDQYGSSSTPPVGRASATGPTQAEPSPIRTPEPEPDAATARVLSPQVVPAHTDWLHHHLSVTGPAQELAAYRKAAAGAGVIPWTIDLDRMEEDFFLSLAAPPSGQKRTLSLDGARMLAAELREAVGRRYGLAIAQVGRSRACPFDLHALVPVPADVLLLGPDHPDALLWLWTHWGTTQILRHVAEERGSGPRRDAGPGEASWRLTFWSGDWTPWRALERVRADWPGLRFDVRPIYEPT